MDSAECRRDLIVLESDLSQAQARLVKAQDATRHRAVRGVAGADRHIQEGLVDLSPMQDGNRPPRAVGQMDSQALDFQSAIDQTCKGR